MGSFLGLTEKEEVDWREIFFRGPYRRLIFSDAHAAVAENNEDLLATWLTMAQSCRRSRPILAGLWLKRHKALAQLLRAGAEVVVVWRATSTPPESPNRNAGNPQKHPHKKDPGAF